VSLLPLSWSRSDSSDVAFARRLGERCGLRPLEREVLKQWKSDRVFERSVENRAGCPVYHVYDVLEYADEWERVVERLGRWVDFENAYKTMDAGYMESVLWCFKRLYDLGLVYEGEKVVAYCTRCQTSLSNFEARLDDATRLRQDPAATVRFRLRRCPGASSATAAKGPVWRARHGTQHHIGNARPRSSL